MLTIDIKLTENAKFNSISLVLNVVRNKKQNKISNKDKNKTKRKKASFSIANQRQASGQHLQRSMDHPCK